MGPVCTYTPHLGRGLGLSRAPGLRRPPPAAATINCGWRWCAGEPNFGWLFCVIGRLVARGGGGGTHLDIDDRPCAPRCAQVRTTTLGAPRALFVPQFAYGTWSCLAPGGARTRGRCSWQHLAGWPTQHHIVLWARWAVARPSPNPNPGWFALPASHPPIVAYPGPQPAHAPPSAPASTPPPALASPWFMARGFGGHISSFAL